MSERTAFETTVLQIKVIFYTFLYFILFIPLLILSLPILTFRLIASQAKKIFRKDLDKLVHNRSSVLSCDDYSTNPKWNLVVWLTHEGLVDLEKFRKDFYHEHVIVKESNGKLKYPEYQQHYETWLGFQFWRWDDKFDINNHIRIYDGIHQENVINDKNLIQIIKELTWKPWEARRSPWEFIQIPNYEMTNDPSPHISKSIMILRIHHGLGDGYFILKLLLQDIAGINLSEAIGKPSIPKRNLLSRIFLGLFIWIVGPYESMKMIFHAYDSNGWRIPEDRMIKPMMAALTPPIKLNHIKEVKNSHQVSFTAVLYAAIAGGIRRMMIKKGVSVPVEVHTAVAVPMPNHPLKLRNHFIFSFVGLPTGTPDPLKRLKRAEKNVQGLKKSTAPMINFMSVPLFGSLLPNSGIMRLSLKNRHSTCLLSNFPGTPEPGYFKGIKTIDMMFGAGLGPGNVGLGFTLISHTDHIRLLSVVDSNILSSDEEVEELNEMIMNEIDIFKNLINV